MNAEKYDLKLIHILAAIGTNETFSQKRLKEEVFPDLKPLEIVFLIQEMEINGPRYLIFNVIVK